MRRPPSDSTRLYQLYGLRLRTQLHLPCPLLPSPAANPDVDLLESSPSHFAAARSGGETAQYACDAWQRYRLADGSIDIRWPGLFEFLVAPEGDRIHWRRLPGAAAESLQNYLLGQALSYSLVLRGREPLHAATVVVGGRAIALLGDSGYGKSTLAAAFLEAGHKLLTDDILVLHRGDGRLFAHPGLPRIKLLPGKTAARFAAQAAPMNPYTAKCLFALGAEQHHGAPAPLRAIYLLPHPRRHSSRIAVRPASPRRVFLSLIENTFNAAISGSQRLQQQFRFAEEVARAVPAKMLRYPRQLEKVPAVVDAVLADLAAQDEHA